MKWVKISERLPEISKDIRFMLVKQISGLPAIAYRYTDKGFIDKDGYRMQIVTHWLEITGPEDYSSVHYSQLATPGETLTCINTPHNPIGNIHTGEVK